MCGAARLFFERLTERHPVVLVFEDVQWAEPALVDFIDYLLDWSRNHPLFVLTLARPELTERHPGWGSRRRNSTSLSLEPLPPSAMDALLNGLAPGLPPELRGRILDRAEGVPLYAVETVRMLIDRGLLALEGNEYRPTAATAEGADLDVPETLHALIAARLDGLDPRERRFLQDASVLGKTFTKQAAAALSGVEDVDPILTSLVRKEVLSLQQDPRSPERGQYGFLQDLVRRVAYETLSKRERKALHRAAPEADDATAILARARDAMAQAGHRAASLAASDEAERYFGGAAELAEDPVQRAELLEQAADMAWRAGHSTRSIANYEEAVDLFTAAGRPHPAARASARSAIVLWGEGQLDEAFQRLQEASAALADEDADADVGVFFAELGRLYFFKGELDEAMAAIERSLEIAEAIPLYETISQALNTKGLVLAARGRREESLALLKHALQVALDNDLPVPVTRAYINLSHQMSEHMLLDEALAYQTAGIAFARRAGIRWAEWWLLGHLAHTYERLGDWDQAERVAAEIPDPEEEPQATFNARDAAWTLVLIDIARGREDRVRDLIAKYWISRVDATDVQTSVTAAALVGMLELMEGRPREALERTELGLARIDQLGVNHPAARDCWITAMSAALELGDLDAARRVFAAVDDLPAGHVHSYLRAHLARFRAALDAEAGDELRASANYRAAASGLGEVPCSFERAVVQAEHYEWLVRTGHGGDEEARLLAAEAAVEFERLGATPWLERVRRPTAVTT